MLQDTFLSQKAPSELTLHSQPDSVLQQMVKELHRRTKEDEILPNDCY